MPLQTDLGASPYYDDYADNDALKGYYRYLFKPGVSVQNRELQGVQSLFASQVERFADTVYKSGAIVDGCNFTFTSPYPYAKLRDAAVDGTPANPKSYVGYFAKNSANLQAFVVDYADGFEQTDPDLKTIYFHYRNAGSDSNTHAFSPGDALTIFDSNSGVFSVVVGSGGLGFSNTDVVVFTPALVVNVSTGSFTAGDYVTQPSTGANLQIAGVDSTTLANSGQVILSLKPRLVDLANSTVNTSIWSVANADTIRNAANTVVGKVEYVVGAGAVASVSTDGSGRITSVPVGNTGSGYTYAPQAWVHSSNNSSGLSALSLTAQNFVEVVLVANTANAVGNGYAFGVGPGVIYQKGLFLSVEPQTVIVSKYDQSPNAVSVGFRSKEFVVDSNFDTSLLDNVLPGESNNSGAPGADRLQVVPSLVVVASNTAANSNSFFQICSWSEGNPFRQNSPTAFSSIGDELAQRTSDEAGDFVLDKFLVTTRSTFASASEGAKVSVAVDPGTAYVSGYRVQTVQNFIIDVAKGTDFTTVNTQVIDLGYGNYARVNNLGGLFQFSTGDVVTLYDAPKGFLSNVNLVSSANLTPQGNAIGTARIRSLKLESGTVGDAAAVYRLYLFDVGMNAGQNYRSTRSIGYAQSGTPMGIADAVQQLDPTTNANVAVLQETFRDRLVFRAGVESLKLSQNTTYTYRTVDQTVTIANTGTVSKSTAGSPSEFFPWVGNLSSSSLQSLIVIPTGGDLIFSANLAGTVSVNTTANVMTGTATSFVTDLQPGDYVYVFQNTTVHDVRRVTGVSNATSVTLDNPAQIAVSGVGVYRIFPRNVPVPFGVRSGLTGNVSANGQLLTLNFGNTFQAVANTAALLATDVVRRAVNPGTKIATRDQFVKISLANNAQGVAGPWCLGVADAFRLKAVYRGSNSSVDVTSQEVTGGFYLDHNQNEDWLDQSFLFATPQAGLNLTTADWLLVKFDYFTTTTPGYMTTTSYVSSNLALQTATDSVPLANLGSSVNTFEVPELYTTRSDYYDLLATYDFRPIAVASATPSSVANTAPVNPVINLSFGNTASPTNDKKFPSPESSLTADIDAFMGRQDGVYVGKDAQVFVLKGVPSVDRRGRKQPNKPHDTLLLNNLMIPPYPNLPANPSNTFNEIISTRLASERFTYKRLRTRVVKTPLSPQQIETQQPRGYTMAQIGALERRIQALEYVASLSALQTDMTSRVIPSSVNPTIDRFKFGFFVDDYSTQVSQDATNPQYSAAIANNKLTPDTFSWAVRNNGRIAQPYLDFVVVDQENATGNVVLDCIPGGTLANNWVVAQTRGVITNPHGLVLSQGVTVLTEYLTIYDATPTGSGTITVYFDVNSVDFDPCEIFVFQGVTQLYSAAVNGLPLTSDDQTLLKSNAVPQSWFADTTFTPFTVAGNTAFVSGSGKISFAHNPGAGAYTIAVTRQYLNDFWRVAVVYPVDSGVVVCPVTPTPTKSEYVGTLAVSPGTFLLKMLQPFDPPPQVTTQLPTQLSKPMGDLDHISLVPQVFRVNATGLRPGCKHDFSVQGLNKNAKCRQVGKNLGDPLVSDVNGTLSFDYFWTDWTDQDVTHVLLSNSAPILLGDANSRDSVTQASVGASAGVLKLDLSAPHSDAQYSLPVVDAGIPLNFVRTVAPGTYVPPWWAQPDGVWDYWTQDLQVAVTYNNTGLTPNPPM